MAKDILGEMVRTHLDTWHRDYLIPYTQDLYRKGKIDLNEFLSVMAMIRSEDSGDMEVAVELLRQMSKRKGDRE